ncbi:MAG: hypothetical protein WC829_16660 [Hyphomicrobium sp.]|jgi:hypothetical protein
MTWILALILCCATVFNSASTAPAACITDWSIAAPIVYKEKLTTVEALSRIAADRLAGSSIVRTALCEADGAFYYRIVMRDSHGRLSTHSVDARAPFGK